MRVVISDSSVLIDLAKIHLLEHLSPLPYEFMIPDVMFADELIDLKDYHRDQLLTFGFQLGSLSDKQVETAFQYVRQYQSLSGNDCFALVLAESISNAILLTGDNALRKTAQAHQVETHGILWVCEQMGLNYPDLTARVLQGLETLRQDPRSRIPRKELNQLIHTLQNP